MRRLVLLVLLTSILPGGPNFATAGPGIQEASNAFGAYPFARGMHLSPDGMRASFITQHASDIPLTMVIDLKNGGGAVILASDKKKGIDIQWCDWKNDTRLLCGFYGIVRDRHVLIPHTRLVAVGDDASNVQTLAQRQQRDHFSNTQGEIVDWLASDRSGVLLQVRKNKGKGVSFVDVNKNRLTAVERPRDGVWSSMSNGRGDIVLRLHISDQGDRTWRYRQPGEKAWKELHKSKAGDRGEDYSPQGFGDDPNKLLIFSPHKGLNALWSIDLKNELKRELVYAHPVVDVGSLITLGRFRRVVGITYSTDKPKTEYFDKRIEKIMAQISGQAVSGVVSIVDESWDQRFYLVHIERDSEPGTYYRFDSQSGTLFKILDAYPKLRDTSLGEVKSIEYPSDDGVLIPGYLTLPAESSPGESLPTILMPHGGPYARDEWGFDFLAQFLASQGYAVLQSNYRGSSGYGEEWEGEGGLKGWKRAITDLEWGLQHLVAEGIADPKRICAVGWSYGGYAALMSALEYPDRHRCVVSIAGVTDQRQLISEARSEARSFIGSSVKDIKEMVGRDEASIKAGSPQKRATELKVPILLFHGDMDTNVSIAHSKKMKKALKKRNVQFIEYKREDHNLRREGNRIDMLNRVGEFLEKNLAAGDPK